MFLLIGQAVSSLNYYVATILPPAVVAFGGLGNLFSLLVFILSPLRKLRSSSFLIGLSVVHLVSLGCILLVWLEKVNVFLVGKPGWCQALNYFFHVANFLGVAFVLAFTVERYISSCWQRDSNLRSHGTNMHRKCVAVTIALVVVVAVVYSFIFGMLGSVKGTCRFVPLPGHNLKTKKIPMYILHFTHILLALMLLVTLGLDICIMITLLRKNRSQKEENGKFVCNGADSRSLQRDFSDSVAGSVDNLSIGHAYDLTGRDGCHKSRTGTLPRPLRVIRSRELRRSRSLLSIRSKINATRMLFAASLTFTLLQILFAGLQFFRAVLFFSNRSKEYEANVIVYNLIVSLYIVSLAVGFVIYMFCGYNFREAVKMLLTCQYTDVCIRSCCCRSEPRRRRSPTALDNPDMDRSTPVHADSVSRYIDDVSVHPA